jgi:hypothetical protein
MKHLSLLACIIMSGSLFANNLKEWKPKYRVQKLDRKATISSSKNKANIQKSNADSVKLRSSSVSKKVSKSQVPFRKSTPLTEEQLDQLYKVEYKKKSQYQNLKNKTLAMTQKAVPTLIKVIKSADYPDKNRWIAMFMLGRVMGKKSSNFISKFTAHPNWMLRLASLKVLLALQQKQYKGLYTRMLKDKAMIVRHQALENIKSLELKELAPYVWAMLYDKSNYAGTNGSRKRSHIIKEAIKTVGDLEFEKSKGPMLKMIKDKKYKDVFAELDYSLNKMSQKKSPEGGIKEKQYFWSRISVADKIIR